MGFLSSVRDAYRGVDRAVTGAERRALEIAVPKKDRKSAKELAQFLDRFAGMIATDAPNTDVAPSFVHETLAPFREARKNPTPWNLYAATAAALPVLHHAGTTGMEQGRTMGISAFPWGTESHAGPREWAAKAVPGGRIVNTETEQSPTYRFIPPGADQPIRNVYNDVTMHDAHSHINMLSHTDRSVPREILHEFMAPLNNRFQVHGIPIDAMPVNVKVAASVLRHDVKPGEKKYTPYTVRQSTSLLQSQLEDLTAVAESMMTHPSRAASFAQGIRQQLQTNDASPRAFAKALKIYEGWVRSPEGGDDPRYELPSFARGQGIVDLMKKIQDPEEWQQRTSGIVVPGGHVRPPGRQTIAPTSAEVEQGAAQWWNDQHPTQTFDTLGTHHRNSIRTHWAMNEWPRIQAERPPDEGPSLTFEPHWYEARSQHTQDEWARMSRAERDDAAERVSNDLPARAPDIQPHETLADLGLIEPADLSLGQNTRPSLTEITRSGEAGTRLQSSFEDFVSQREQAARHAQAGVGDAEWRRMSPEERDSLIRAQMAQNRRSEAHSQGASGHMQALADRADELHRSGIELDITERAVLEASRGHEWHDLTEQERQAEVRRIRRRLAHESQR